MRSFMGGAPHEVAVTPLCEQCPGAAVAGLGPHWKDQRYSGVGLDLSGGMGWGQGGERPGSHRH